MRFLLLDWVVFGLGLVMIDVVILVDLIFVLISVAIVAAVRSRLGINRFKLE